MLNRITKSWGLWDNVPPYGVYLQHDETERSLNENFDRLILGSGDVQEYLRDDEWRSIYERAPMTIMRSDIIRVLALYHRGGWYSDLDVLLRCGLQKITTDNPNIEVILFTEEDYKKDWPCPKEKKQMTLRIAFDVFFVSKEKHPFLKHALNLLKERCSEPGFEQSAKFCDVMYYTGPDFWTTSYHTYPDKQNIKVYNQREGYQLIDFTKRGIWREKL